MERELQQLLIIVAVIAFSLLDLFLRWAKKKVGGEGQRPLPPPDDDAEDEAYETYEVNVPWPLPDAPPARVPEPLRLPEPVRSAPMPVLVRQKAVLPERSGDSLASRRLVSDAVRAEQVAAADGRRRGPAVFTERDARRAIVLAAVFGPCRAVEEYR